METKRKPIRLTAILKSDETETLIALCDDGTIWQYEATDDTWERLSMIPQSKITDDE